MKFPSKEHRISCERHGFAILPSGLVLLALCAPADARDRSNTDMARQSLALDLVRYGDRKKDALALIQAARMQQELGTQVKDGSPLSVALLLQRARSYAPARADLALLIDDAAASGSRGAQAGPVLEHFLAPVNELQRLVVRFTNLKSLTWRSSTPQAKRYVFGAVRPVANVVGHRWRQATIRSEFAMWVPPPVSILCFITDIYRVTPCSPLCAFCFIGLYLCQR
jgi:hypothetical protein